MLSRDVEQKASLSSSTSRQSGPTHNDRLGMGMGRLGGRANISHTVSSNSTVSSDMGSATTTTGPYNTCSR